MYEDKQTTVRLFGREVTALKENGVVMFDRKSFISAIGRDRANRIFASMRETFDFMGDEGVEWVVGAGKEHLLCQLVLMDPDATPELKEYAGAWMIAYEKLAGME